MLLFTLFLSIVTVQLFGFLLASFPFFALTRKISSKTELDSLLEKIDKVIVDRACIVTGDCGECQTISEGGIIESPNYSDGYHPNLNCLFTIKAPLGMKIQLNFTEFLVKKCCDFLTVFDGLANPLQIEINSYDTPSLIISPSNRMAIKFTTSVDDAMVNVTKVAEPLRWKAIYTFV